MPLTLLVLILVGCLESLPCQEGSGRLYPLADSAWWRHDRFEYDSNPAAGATRSCKLVWAEPPTLVPGWPVQAWPVHSLTYEPSSATYSLSVRWQADIDYNLYRELDESYIGSGTDGVRTEVEYYCPMGGRVYDCPGGCPSSDESCGYDRAQATWEENYKRFVRAP